jgi:hypothetical protein
VAASGEALEEVLVDLWADLHADLLVSHELAESVATASREIVRLGSYFFAWTATRDERTGVSGASPIASIPSSPDPPIRRSSSPYALGT